MNFRIFALLILIFLIFSCGEEKPEVRDPKGESLHLFPQEDVRQIELGSGSADTGSAVVNLPGGKPQVVIKGDSLGKSGARVTGIQRNRLVLEEVYKDRSGLDAKRYIVINRLPDGGQKVYEYTFEEPIVPEPQPAFGGMERVKGVPSKNRKGEQRPVEIQKK